MIYDKFRKKYKEVFKENRKELENPNYLDVVTMDSLSLDEINETIKDRKNILFKKYHESMLEIFAASEKGVIVRPTSGGLYKPATPTNDFIDDQPQDFNPFDDTGID
jgi:hypothetical protein